ncbi:MAG: heme exporter protein CcmB [Thermoplasmatota archaeon]
MSLRLLAWKDLRRELAGREALQAGAVLVLLFLLVDLFAVRDLASEPRIATLVLWMPLLYATAAAALRGPAAEADRGTLDLLRLAAVDPVLHGVSRVLVDLLVVAVLAGLTVAAAAAFFLVPIGWPLVAVLALAAVGITVVAALAGALAAQARARETLLPILLVPVAAPLVQAGVQGTLAALAGATWADLQVPLLLLVGLDLVYAGLAWLLWPVLMEGD